MLLVHNQRQEQHSEDEYFMLATLVAKVLIFYLCQLRFGRTKAIEAQHSPHACQSTTIKYNGSLNADS